MKVRAEREKKLREERARRLIMEKSRRMEAEEAVELVQKGEWRRNLEVQWSFVRGIIAVGTRMSLLHEVLIHSNIFA